ncbi:MAG: ATP-binding cassette domain-containing protein, partial [Acutalibacteraceae bacterium]|nr:ATP-binding cassette domain-containing protein [Acutalibacteraceae bacterium]
MENKFIEVKNVTFQYDGEETEKKAAVKNINLSFERGSFNVILGHNGSGKSTLAKLLGGMIKPDNGEVFVDGLSTLDENNEYEIRRRLGLVFQNPDNQIICTIVEEDVAFGPENLGVEPKEIRRRVDDALA